METERPQDQYMQDAQEDEINENAVSVMSGFFPFIKFSSLREARRLNLNSSCSKFIRLLSFHHCTSNFIDYSELSDLG